jgi:peptide/nickel transport system substrate-binding protein
MTTIRRARWLAVLLALALVAAACTSSGTSDTTEDATNTTPAAGGETEGSTAPETEEPTAPTEFDRAETLYTGGKQWSPPANWNPINSDYVTGIFGLVYEPMFLYDPLTDEYIPWLAESGEWTGDNTYEVTLREGMTWTDGEAIGSDDVVTTFNLAQFPSNRFSVVWQSLESVEANGDLGVTFTFTDPAYQQWRQQLYQMPIVPHHLWAERSEEEVAQGANEGPVGSGPYMYESHDQTRQVYVRNDGWWGTEALGLEMAPTRIVDLVNINNNTALGQVLEGNIDLNNNFLPGVSRLKESGYGLHTYFEEAPYMLAANTAWLVPNTTQPPLDDPAFRRALAFSVDTSQIVNGVYGNMVSAASPTGLLPVWDEYIDQAVVDEHGFSYNPDQARTILADAGYVDGDGDGFVEAPDGSAIDLSLIVPNGWTDWMESIRVISDGAAEVGIRVTPEFPDFAALLEARNSGNFDLVINNEKQISATPWEYFDYMFRLPIEEQQVTSNFSRYENEDAWNLVQQFDQTPETDTAALQDIASQLEEILLTDLPVIPLWYNGAWSQANTGVWSGWPSAEGENNYFPVTWNGWWTMTGVLMLSELEPTPEG